MKFIKWLIPVVFMIVSLILFTIVDIYQGRLAVLFFVLGIIGLCCSLFSFFVCFYFYLNGGD